VAVQDQSKTKAQLLCELAELRQRVAELEAAEVEHKQAAAALNVSESRLRAIIDSAKDSIFIKDTNLNYVVANPAMAELFGMPLQDILGKSDWDLFDEETARHIKAVDRQVFAGQTIEEQPIKAIQGVLHTFHTIEVPLYDKQGQVIGLCGIARDITERKQAEEEIRKRTAQLEALQQVGLEVAVELDLDTLLHSIVSQAIQLVGGISGGLYLYRPDRDVLEWAVVVGPNLAPVGSFLRRGEGLSGRIWQTGQPRIVDDYQHWEGGAAVYAGYPIVATVGVPVRSGSEFLGVLNVAADAPRLFSSADAELLSLFAAQAAIAIKNARLFQSEREQRALAETLREVGATLVATLDADAVLDRILEQIGRVVPNDAVNIIFIEGDQARVARWRGYERFGVQERVDNARYRVADVPYFQQMLETGEPVLVSDAQADPKWVGYPETRWLHSYAGVPIRARGRVIGFLNVDSATPGFFGPAHVERLRAFADQAAIALENASLFSSLAQENEQLELLYRLSRQLAENLDVRRAAQRALDGICAVVGARRGIVLVRDAALSDLLRLATVSGYDAKSTEILDRQLQLQIGRGLAGWVAAHRQSALVDDVTTDPRWLAVPQLDDWVRSALSVPLVSGDELVGVLSIYNDRVAYFGDEHLRLVESAAATVAVAIANARLYQAEREQHRRLQASQARLVQAEKMAALGRLVASVAHEINNPLQAVMGALELFEEETAGAARQERLQRYLGVAGRETERIAAIVRRVCDFYRPTRERQQPTDVRAVLTTVLELADPQLRANNVTVVREWTNELPVIQASPDRLKQVFLNLALNAIDAMAERGGTLRVRAALDQMQWHDDQSRPAVRIEFSDTGVGIAPEALESLFEPFSTTKPNGTGLGLAISYEIIQDHDGQITATSHVGVGTTFTILLPADRRDV
jgi:PAS domain S-box-containing protein